MDQGLTGGWCKYHGPEVVASARMAQALFVWWLADECSLSFLQPMSE